MGEGEDTIRLGVRLPASIHHKLQEQAREHNRSLNSEIVTLLVAGLQANEILSQAEQTLSKAEREVRESEHRVYASNREQEKRLKIYSARVDALAAEFQEIKARAPIPLNEETIGLLEPAGEAAERKGKTLGDVIGEAIRKVVSEEEPE